MTKGIASPLSKRNKLRKGDHPNGNVNGFVNVSGTELVMVVIASTMQSIRFVSIKKRTTIAPHKAVSYLHYI